MLQRLIVVVLLLFFAAPIHAQPRGVRTPVSRTELQSLAAEAGLDKNEQAAAAALIEGCDNAMKRADRRRRGAYERIQLADGDLTWEAVSKLYNAEEEKAVAAQQASVRVLLDDLRSLIPKDKDEAWTKFNCRRHRRLLLNGEMDGGMNSPDLVAIAAALKLDGPQVSAVLGPYELELDRLLLAREAVDGTYITRMTRALEQHDDAAAEKAYTEQRDANCAIVNLGRSAARRLIAVAPALKRDELETLILAGRGPNMDTKPAVRARAERLLGSGRLDESRRATLADAVASFDRRLRIVNDAGLTELEDHACGLSYQQSRGTWDGTTGKRWSDDNRKLQAELLAVLDRIATEDDLDAVDVTRPARPD